MPETENKLLVKLSVRIAGSTKDYAVSSMYLNQAVGSHHQFNIDLRGEELDEAIMQELQTQLGKPLEIKFFQGNTIKVKFKGVITGINLSNDSDAHKAMTLTGSGDTIRMDDGKHARCFKDKTYGEIIDDIKTKYSNIKFEGKNNSKGAKLPIFIQYKESNFNVILRLAELSGKWAYYNGMEFIIENDLRSDEIKNIIIGETGAHYQIEANLIPTNLEYRTYNYLENKDKSTYTTRTKSNKKINNPLVNTVVDASSQLFRSNTISPSIEYHVTEQDFNNYGSTMQSTYISGSVRISGSSTDPSLGIGDVLDIIEKKQGTQLSIGKFIVIQIQHSSNVSGFYQNHFEAIPREVDHPPLNTNIIYPKAEDQTATVIDNEDPERMGRVKVQFIWQDDRNDSNWIRVLSPMGGENHGLFYIPEINDHVLIGFEYDNPNRPYVKGSFYNRSQNTGQLYDRFGQHAKKQAEGRIKSSAEKAIKGIFTRQGHDIAIDDNGVTIYTKDGEALLCVSVANNGMVYINTQGKVIISSKEITVDAIDKINLVAKDISVKASNNLELSGGSEVKVKGGMIKLN